MHTLIIYLDTSSDTFAFFSLFACHILASILVDECIFKPASQDSVAAANRLRSGCNIRRRSGDQEGSNHKSASGGVLETHQDDPPVRSRDLVVDDSSALTGGRDVSTCV